MLESAIKSKDDPRLGKAGELAEYLRQNPRATRQDPEELASRFGVSAGLVEQLQATRFLSGSERNRQPVGQTLLEWGRRAGKAIGKSVDSITGKPYLFLGATALAAFLAPYLSAHQLRISAVVGVWCALQVLCIFLQPKFRYVLFGAVLNLIVISGFMYETIRHAKLPSMFDAPSGHIIVSLFTAFAFDVAYVMTLGLVVLAGGSFQLAAERRRQSKLSRHDLLTRMFQLQEQLATIPERTQKRARPFFALIRKNLLLSAALAFLGTYLLTVLALLIYHVDIQTLMRMRDASGSSAQGSGPVRIVLPGALPPGFIGLLFTVGMLRDGVLLFFGFFTNSPRKVLLATLALVAGEAFGRVLTLPLGPHYNAPLSYVSANLLGSAVSALLVLSIVRFALVFNRSLNRLRTDYVPNEAELLSELVGIRHRLASDPVQVCVLVVDAVGSTKMKENEDPLLVEYSFHAYQTWIAENVSKRGGKVEMVTGDGAICAFGKTDAALEAARGMQADIETFNKTRNRLGTPFRLRVALHAGAVVADLDKVQYTQVIDVACHVEKYSPVGGIALTDPFLKAMVDMPSMQKQATVDGVDVYVYDLAAALAL